LIYSVCPKNFFNFLSIPGIYFKSKDIIKNIRQDQRDLQDQQDLQDLQDLQDQQDLQDLQDQHPVNSVKILYFLKWILEEVLIALRFEVDTLIPSISHPLSDEETV
jgi:hypothetical protein